MASFVDITPNMVLDQPTESILNEMTLQVEQNAADRIHPVFLCFRDAEVEAEYQRRKVWQAMGMFALSMVMMLLNYVVVIAVILLIYGLDNLTIVMFGLFITTFCLFLLVMVIWFTEQPQSEPSNFFLWLHKMAGYITPFMNLNLIGLVCVILMFASVTLQFREQHDPIYLAACIFLVLWNTTSFSALLRSFYLSVCVVAMVIVFLVIAVTVAYNVFQPILDTLLPNTIVLAIGVIMSNSRIERTLRVNYLMRQAMNEQVRRVYDLQSDSDLLLHNILPAPVVDRLKRFPTSVIAERMESVAIIFADIVNFSAYRARVDSVEATKVLNQMICGFDALSHDCGIEKIKTHGAMYMAVAGLGGSSTASSVRDVANFALAMQSRLVSMSRHCNFPFTLKVGINVGAVIGGVIGLKKV